jgi:enediyne biosynthesis protein E4
MNATACPRGPMPASGPRPRRPPCRGFMAASISAPPSSGARTGPLHRRPCEWRSHAGGYAMRSARLFAAMAFWRRGLPTAMAAGEGPPSPNSSTRRQAPGIDSVFEGEWEFMVGGGVATFDCSGNGFPDMLLAGGEAPAKFYRNISDRGGGRFASRKKKAAWNRRRRRRLSARHRWRRHHGSRAPARRRECRDARSGRLPLRARQRGLGLRRRRCLVVGLRRHLGRRRGLAHHRHRQLHRPRRADGALGLVHRQLAAPPGRGWRGFAAAAAADARATARCPCCSPTGTGPARPACASPTTANITAAGRSSCGASSRARNRASTPRRRAGQRLRIWGMGIAGYDLNGDGYPAYFLTSMADNKLQAWPTCPRTARPPAL